MSDGNYCHLRIVRVNLGFTVIGPICIVRLWIAVAFVVIIGLWVGKVNSKKYNKKSIIILTLLQFVHGFPLRPAGYSVTVNSRLSLAIALLSFKLKVTE